MTEQTSKIAQDFAAYWQTRFQKFPLLHLDHSWFSLGTVDHLALGLRGQKDYSSADLELLTGISAYLGTIIAPILESVGIKSDQGLIKFSERIGIYLEAQNSLENLADKSPTPYFVHIQEKIAQRLSRPEILFPYIGDTLRPVAFNSQLINLFAASLALGLCAQSEGNEKKLSFLDYQPTLEQAVKKIAQSCADTYGKLFPAELVGQSPEVYMEGVLFPPPYIEEDYPYTRAINRFLEYAAEVGIGTDHISAFSTNLARVAEEQLSDFGFILLAATSGSALPEEVLAISEAKGLRICQLREAYAQAYQIIWGTERWTEIEKLAEPEADAILLETELGFHPWLKLEHADLMRNRLRPLLSAIAALDLKSACQISEDLKLLASEAPAVRAQAAYLVMLRGGMQEAYTNLQDALKDGPECKDEAQIHYLLGLCALRMNKPDQAFDYFRTAQSLVRGFRRQDLLIRTNLATLLMVKNENEQALKAFSDILEARPLHIFSLINRAVINSQLQKFDLVTQDVKTTMNFLPTHPEVFRNILYFTDPDSPEWTKEVLGKL
ncbi:hypothetical protein JNK13_05475 [bacterium]|nr:hypothetical protein [bacterium]